MMQETNAPPITIEALKQGAFQKGLKVFPKKTKKNCKMYWKLTKSKEFKS